MWATETQNGDGKKHSHSRKQCINKALCFQSISTSTSCSCGLRFKVPCYEILPRTSLRELQFLLTNIDFHINQIHPPSSLVHVTTGILNALSKGPVSVLHESDSIKLYVQIE